MARSSMLGKTIDGRYQVLGLLGQGGMGAVYEVRHVGTGRRHALKIITGELAATPDVVARFMREGRAVGAIESQHVVQVTDSGIDPVEGIPFMVMDFLVGEDLQKLVQRLGALPPDLALRIAAQTCVGLQKAHEVNVFHRDIKPANLFLSHRDEGEIVVRLLDFGIAKVKMDQLSASGDQGYTRTGSMLGSPLYMSPEQAQGFKTIDHRTDIWSMGAVLYEALTGRTPHHGIDTIGQLIVAICTTEPRSLREHAPWVPEQVAEIAHGALRLDPNQRYPSAAAMLDAIRRLLPGGLGLHQSMLVPLNPAERQSAAPVAWAPSYPPSYGTAPSAFSTTPSTAGSNPPPSLGGSTPAPASFAANPALTADPVSTTGRRSAPSKLPVIGLLLGGVAFLGIAAVWWFGIRNKVEIADLSGVVSAPVVVPSALPVAESSASSALVQAPVPSSQPASESDRTVRVQVSPPSAQVEIAGAPVPVQDGSVVIRGPIGSSHSFRATAAGRQSTGRIVIEKSGPVPARIEVAAASVKRNPRESAKPSLRPSSQPQPVAASPATPVSPPAAKPSKPGAPSLDTTFQ